MHSNVSFRLSVLLVFCIAVYTGTVMYSLFVCSLSLSDLVETIEALGVYIVLDVLLSKL